MVTSKLALDRIMSGNAAFAAKNLSYGERTQRPYGVVLTCSDSRMPPEQILSAEAGELFVIRTAGAVVDEIALGSISYGVKQLGATLILVLGHTDCGAVAAALSGETEGSIGIICAKIRDAIGDETDPRICERLNVLHTVEEIRREETVRTLQMLGRVEVLGAIYDLKTGWVELLEQ